MENKFCRDCVHSATVPDSDWRLQCVHKKVLGQNAHTLASPKPRGVDASDERALSWPWGRCGKRGALWEPKPWEAPV